MFENIYTQFLEDTWWIDCVPDFRLPDSWLLALVSVQSVDTSFDGLSLPGPYTGWVWFRWACISDRGFGPLRHLPFGTVRGSGGDHFNIAARLPPHLCPVPVTLAILVNFFAFFGETRVHTLFIWFRRKKLVWNCSLPRLWGLWYGLVNDRPDCGALLCFVCSSTLLVEYLPDYPENCRIDCTKEGISIMENGWIRWVCSLVIFCWLTPQWKRKFHSSCGWIQSTNTQLFFTGLASAG
jgi:hypothetical protein